ncbi:hypothetical protein K7P57_002551, partial [Enterococcus faecalis]|nr:hypothetical protein [Enterococcus faecalis]
IMTEAVDTEIFGQEYLCPLIKNFEKEYKKETLDEYILNLFKETELTIEIETKTDVKGSVMSISSLMWVLEILENKCWFGDFIYELTEQQILSLLEKPYAKKNNQYEIELHQEQDIMLLKNIGAYEELLHFIEKVEQYKKMIF